ncbi:HlyD family secretion protein [Parabacteroides merdae]|uniref:HlyD family efflux transporter periplasmic adaptor subunit n=1 Tax=Parabacteroides merdae TaxID=46503 RepID=A0A7K1HFT9_9BACT|nr:efflux RND transporter periplasmic adaptor subunit [Parabacteroides merdae]MTU29432.1 HlyD family efflux transporter periplasmic adaptor subunit [Parabacteroides merdae]RYS83592.1 HlyD family efflux transporter periplasmic adaptor subunit [Parabacteroides merdae]
MKQNEKKHKDINKILLIAFVLLIAIIVFILIGIFIPDKEEVIQGEVETTDYRVSSKVPARVLELRVKEGEYVKQGDTLALLEAPDLKAKLMQARAAERVAAAMNQKTERGTRSEQLQEAYGMWQKAKAGLSIAEKSYVRLERLFSEGVVSEQKRDEAKANYEAMAATEKAVRAQYEMAVNGAQVEDREAAQAQTLRAQGAVEEVNSYMKETILLAPCDGEVTEIYPEIGELVGTGAPIMNIAAKDDLWFTFNIREDLLPGIQVGKKFSAYLPALGQTIQVQISLMKDEGSFAVWKATKALDSFDLKTFEVQARPLEQVQGLHAGMSVILSKGTAYEN